MLENCKRLICSPSLSKVYCIVLYCIDNEHRLAFMATNELSSFRVSMNNNARYDRSTNFLELEVHVPRTIGILRDVINLFLCVIPHK